MKEEKDPKGPISELAHRGVIQAVAIWVAVAWGGTEILITAAERFGWPGWIADAALVLFLTGLPFVILVAWAFDLSGSGLQRVDPGSMRGKVALAVIATVVIGLTAAVMVLWDRPQAVPDQPVIAVLPFQDFTGQDGGALTALSFTGELIHRIGAHPDLTAIDLRTVTSPMAASMLAVGDTSRLRADFVVLGELNAARGGVELKVRMTDAAGGVIWQDEFVSDLEDPIAARDARTLIAGSIAAALGTTLTGVDYCEPSADAAAVRDYYAGWQAYGERGAHGIARAARALESAVERDPNYARAMADLADVYLRFPFWLGEDPSPYLADRAAFDAFTSELPALISDLTDRALTLCPNLGNAYLNREWGAAETSIERREVLDEALRRSPGDLSLLNMAITVHRTAGHIEEAIAAAEHGYRRDPLNARMPHQLAGLLAAAGDPADALALDLEARALGYDPLVADLFIAAFHIAAGDADGLDAHWTRICVEHAGALCDEAGNHIWHRFMPLDPRLVLRARQGDEDARVAIETAVHSATPSLDARNLGRWSRWLVLTGDENLVWAVIDEADGDVGDFYDAFWHFDLRGRVDEARIMAFLERMGSDLPSYWSTYGPPDGCDWDGESLSCSAANRSDR